MVEPISCFSAVLDLFEISNDGIAFIVMEEWSSQLITSAGPCCLKSFLAALRQVIEVRAVQLSPGDNYQNIVVACCVYA